MAAMLSAPTPAGGVVGRITQADPLDMLGSFNWPRLSVVNENNEPMAFIISTEGEARVQPLPEEARSTPHVIVDFEVFRAISEMTKDDPSIRIHVENPSQDTGVLELVNIVTSTPESDSYVLICAHYDTTFNSLGALDNASGVAVALRLAHEAKRDRLPCRFAFFDGEELNHAGSSGYVSDMADCDLCRIAAVVEIDTVGAGNELVLLCSKKLSRPLNAASFLQAIPDDFTVNVRPQSRITFCDVWPFMTRKIPVVRMLTRTPRGSGGLNVIHTDHDTVDKVDPSILNASLSAASSLVRLFAHDPAPS